MTYPMLNGTQMGSNLGYIFVYANSITHGLAGLFMVVAFFCVTFFGSLLMQQKMTGTIRPETSLAAASYVSFGFAVIIEQMSGILSAGYFWMLGAICILSTMWLIWDSD